MKEILEKANNLGRMIQGTDVYRRYSNLHEKFEADHEARSLLAAWEERAVMVEQKQKSGIPAEHHELEEVKELAESIKGNDLLASYLAAKQEYIDLLTEIQGAVTGEDLE